MADISSITLPGGGTYDLKDKNAVPKYGKGKNLLDNAYFVGGGTGRGVFPVNQRGQSSYTGLVYGIDRWYSLTTDGILTIGADYITLQAATYNFNWRQTLSRKVPIGSAVTITILKGDGSLVYGSGTLSSSTSFIQVYLTSGYIRAYYDYVQITTGANSSNTIKAIWLELGTEQTLCHNEGTTENPVWVMNEIPDYEYELYRCITSTADSSDIYANKVISTNVSKPNLLRNWYFVGGGTGRGVLPVNQRGFTTSSNVNHVWSIDSWYINGGVGTQTLNSTGFYLAHTGTSGSLTLQQWVGNSTEYAGKVMTLSVIVDGVLVSGTGTIQQKTSATQYAIKVPISQNVALNMFVLPSSEPGYVVQFQATTGKSLTVQAVKLEYGTEQTLAHQENGTWVLNEIPDYEEELIRCITYSGYTGTIPDTYDEKSLATRQDLTSIQATGTTNTTGAAIPAGAYFYLNGVLHRAKVQIDQNATFTVNTNCEAVTVGTELQKTVFDKQTTNGTFYDIAPGWASKALDNVVANISNYQSGVYNVSSSGGPDFIVVLGKLNNTYYSGLIFNYNSSFFGLFQYFNGQKTLKQIAQI